MESTGTTYFKEVAIYLFIQRESLFSIDLETTKLVYNNFNSRSINQNIYNRTKFDISMIVIKIFFLMNFKKLIFL